MKIVVRWTTPAEQCNYLPDHTSEHEYLSVASLNPDEYMALLIGGWRRFGHMVFRQTCSGPGACRSLRVDVTRFRPDRSQRRACKTNAGVVTLRIGKPTVTAEKVALLDRFHAERSRTKGWSLDEPGDTGEYERMFVINPFPTQEWCYFLGDVLVGVGYVDLLPGGLSAIYFARDPGFSDRSLGTWNVLCIVERAASLGLPHVYLGYHTEGSPSLHYKGRFRPNQSLELDGVWREDLA
jgi:leucyl-tRNA---protein transferase